MKFRFVSCLALAGLTLLGSSLVTAAAEPRARKKAEKTADKAVGKAAGESVGQAGGKTSGKTNGKAGRKTGKTGDKAAAVIPPASAADAAAAMLAAAQTFLAALRDDQKRMAQHPFDDEVRQEIKYVPSGRTGVPLKALDGGQRQLVHELLKTGLSQPGHLKISQIIELEGVLAELERNPVRRDPENYYVWIFGEPKAKARWGWKFEGHHLSFHFTLAETGIASVPTFMGANPAEVRNGPLTGRRALAAEEDLARKLVLSFADKERAAVVFDAKAPPEILTADRSSVTALPDVGVPVASMSTPQRELLRQVLAAYAETLTPALAAERMARVDAGGFDKVRFGWAGGTAKGEKHYYRIAGPTFVLEYDNTQDGGNHVHTVWRDFTNDFGRDLLRDHLKKAH